MAPPAPTTIAVHGYAVREFRKVHGISVATLAESAEVTRAYIAKIELGHSRRVSPQLFNRLLDALAIEDRRALLCDPHAADSEAVA